MRITIPAPRSKRETSYLLILQNNSSREVWVFSHAVDLSDNIVAYSFEVTDLQGGEYTYYIVPQQFYHPAVPSGLYRIVKNGQYMTASELGDRVQGSTTDQSDPMALWLVEFNRHDEVIGDAYTIGNPAKDAVDGVVAHLYTPAAGVLKRSDNFATLFAFAVYTAEAGAVRYIAHQGDIFTSDTEPFDLDLELVEGDTQPLIVPNVQPLLSEVLVADGEYIRVADLHPDMGVLNVGKHCVDNIYLQENQYFDYYEKQ